MHGLDGEKAYESLSTPPKMSQMYNRDVHKRQFMSTSIAQSRQQLSWLIDAAQSTPQIITKRNAPVAVLVSPDYFKRTEAMAHGAASFYSSLMALRSAYEPSDDVGIPCASEAGGRATAWVRTNHFTDPA